LLVAYAFYNYNYLRLEPFDNMPSWSPDGQRVVFACLRRERARDRRPNVTFGPYEGYDQFKLEEICVVDSNGRNRLQLTDNHISDDFPVWSPDGHQIAYVSGSERVEADIYVADVDAGNPINVTHNPASYGIPHWSPSGEYLLFASNGGDGFHQLSILRLRDGEVTQLPKFRPK
jgi:Tol biopolymer transport system component